MKNGGEMRKGRRPGFSSSMPIEYFCDCFWMVIERAKLFSSGWTLDTLCTFILSLINFPLLIHLILNGMNGGNCSIDPLFDFILYVDFLSTCWPEISGIISLNGRNRLTKIGGKHFFFTHLIHPFLNYPHFCKYYGPKTIHTFLFLSAPILVQLYQFSFSRHWTTKNKGLGLFI